jgi:hypothetical protein
MSRLNASLYSSETHTWQTPPNIIDPLLDFLGVKQFEADVCTTEKNIPAKVHMTESGMCGLASMWPKEGYCWMNPPYGNALKMWLKKAYEESLTGSNVWALVPARTETKYQHEYGLTKAGFVVFLSGRITFHLNGVKGPANAPFPTMLLYYGKDSNALFEQWCENPPLQGIAMKGHQK